MKRMNYLFILIGILVILLVITQWRQIESFSTQCPEKLVFNGKSLELWRSGKIERVFSSYDDYLSFYKFSQLANAQKGLLTCPLLSPIVGKRTPQGSMVDSRYIDPLYFNAEHFEGDAKMYILAFEGTDALEYPYTAVIENADNLSKVIDDTLIKSLNLKGALQTGGSPLIKPTSADTIELSGSVNKLTDVYQMVPKDASKKIQIKITSSKLDSVQPRFVWIQAGQVIADVPMVKQEDGIILIADKHITPSIPTPTPTPAPTPTPTPSLPKISSTPISPTAIPSFPPTTSKSKSEQLQDEKTALIVKSQEVIMNYLSQNPVCRQRIMNKDNQFYYLFEKAYENYMKSGFKKTLGYVPQKSDIESMNLDEAHVYVTLYQNMPKCEVLISKYGPASSASTEEGSRSSYKPPKVSLTPTQETSLVASSMMIPSSTIPTTTDLRLRRYVDAVGQQLQTGFENLIGNASTLSPTPLMQNMNPAVVSSLEKGLSQYLDQDLAIRKASQTNKNNVLSDVVSAVSKEFGGRNAGKSLEQQLREVQDQAMKLAPDFIKKGKTFNEDYSYTPDVKFDHMKPSNEIYSAYGWSYMPPQSWSVPQQRPPVCIPSKGQASKVTPIYDKSAPMDVLDWTQVGSIMPKFEYKEVYDPKYYYPGWKSRD